MNLNSFELTDRKVSFEELAFFEMTRKCVVVGTTVKNAGFIGFIQHYSICTALRYSMSSHASLRLTSYV